MNNTSRKNGSRNTIMKNNIVELVKPLNQYPNLWYLVLQVDGDSLVIQPIDESFRIGPGDSHVRKINKEISKMKKPIQNVTLVKKKLTASNVYVNWSNQKIRQKEVKTNYSNHTRGGANRKAAERATTGANLSYDTRDFYFSF